MVLDDVTLLRRFATERCEDAFAELVRRHVDMVYSVALRRLNGNSGLAQDVAQQVFVDFARKAGRIRPGTIPAAWLHRATHLASAAALRQETRRSTREQHSAAMQELSRPDDTPLWDSVRPVLDEALDAMPARDREALLLRFFRQHSLREVGTALGISEDAARMRVERALLKLRSLLARRGVTATVPSLAGALAANAVQAAPVVLVGAVAGITPTLSVAATGSSTIAVLNTMASTQFKVVLGAALAIGIGTPVLFHFSESVMPTKTDTPQHVQAQSRSPRAADPNENGEVSSDPDNAKLARLQTEVLRGRAVINHQAKQLQELADKNELQEKLGMPVASEPGTPFKKNVYHPVNAWRDVGLDSPEAAVQTGLWAMTSVSLERMAQAVGLSSDEKVKMLARFTPEAIERMPTAGAVGVVVKEIAETGPAEGARLFVCELDRGEDKPPLQINISASRVDGLWRMKSLTMMGGTDAKTQPR